MKYTTADAIVFVNDMTEAGFKVEHYHGRWFWEGPAVRVSDHYELAEVIAATSVSLQWDNMGLGYIVYPVQKDPGLQATTTTT